MKNITQSLRKAIETDLLWSVNQFYVFIERIELLGLKVTHWEGEENWATVSNSNNQLVGYIWQKYPLAFFLDKDVNLLENLSMDFKYVVFITTSDLSYKEFIVNKDVVLSDRLDHLECGVPLSATDIWFNSVN